MDEKDEINLIQKVLFESTGIKFKMPDHITRTKKLKMNAKEFLDFLNDRIEKDGHAFAENLFNVSTSPDTWMEMFVNWMELGSKEDAQMAYPEYYE